MVAVLLMLLVGIVTLINVQNRGSRTSAPPGVDPSSAPSIHLNGPSQLAVAPDGSLYIADPVDDNIRKVDPSGTITSVAGTGTQGFSGDGGFASAANLARPNDVTVTTADTLRIYIADAGNNRVRKIDSSGIITTVAGVGSPGFSGDGGPATAARLTDPIGVAVADDGTLYIADIGNQRVRKIDTSGTITTVAGGG